MLNQLNCINHHAKMKNQEDIFVKEDITQDDIPIDKEDGDEYDDDSWLDDLDGQEDDYDETDGLCLGGDCDRCTEKDTCPDSGIPFHHRMMESFGKVQRAINIATAITAGCLIAGTGFIIYKIVKKRKR